MSFFGGVDIQICAPLSSLEFTFCLGSETNEYFIKEVNVEEKKAGNCTRGPFKKINFMFGFVSAIIVKFENKNKCV